jgi:hypothetical protein
MDRREILARACHAAWYAYTVLGLQENGEMWHDAPEWQKDSIRKAIDFWDNCLSRSAQIGTIDELIIRLSPLSHENWMKDKAADGWVYGEAKDSEKKTHPCMVPYNDLPETQQIKDEVVLQAYLTIRECF